jgi:hypothetical protein
MSAKESGPLYEDLLQLVAAAEANPVEMIPRCVALVARMDELREPVDPEDAVCKIILGWLGDQSILDWLEMVTAPGIVFRCMGVVIARLPESPAGQAGRVRLGGHPVFQRAQRLLLGSGHDDYACPRNAPKADAWDLMCCGYEKGHLPLPGEIAAGAGSSWSSGDFVDALGREVGRVASCWPRDASNELGVLCATEIVKMLLPQMRLDECRALESHLKAAKRNGMCLLRVKCERLLIRVDERIRAAKVDPLAGGAGHAGGGAEWAAMHQELAKRIEAAKRTIHEMLRAIKVKGSHAARAQHGVDWADRADWNAGCDAVADYDPLWRAMGGLIRTRSVLGVARSRLLRATVADEGVFDAMKAVEDAVAEIGPAETRVVKAVAEARAVWSAAVGDFKGERALLEERAVAAMEGLSELCRFSSGPTSAEMLRLCGMVMAPGVRASEDDSASQLLKVSGDTWRACSILRESVLIAESALAEP